MSSVRESVRMADSAHTKCSPSPTGEPPPAALFSFALIVSLFFLLLLHGSAVCCVPGVSHPDADGAVKCAASPELTLSANTLSKHAD